MAYLVVFTPEAEAQLVELFGYIATVASPEAAAVYTNGIVTYCEGLKNFPLRGTRRDDIRAGLRITSYRKRVVIAFAVDAANVSIIGVFYGGRDYESALQEDESEEA